MFLLVPILSPFSLSVCMIGFVVYIFDIRIIRKWISTTNKRFYFRINCKLLCFFTDLDQFTYPVALGTGCNFRVCFESEQ